MSTEMSTEKRWFAWYSEKQFNQIKNAYRNVMYVERKPYIYYYDMDDNIVQVTHVVSVIDGEEPKCSVGFDDMEFIGEVKKYFKTSKYPMTI